MRVETPLKGPGHRVKKGLDDFSGSHLEFQRLASGSDGQGRQPALTYR